MTGPLLSIVQIGLYLMMAVTIIAALGAILLPNLFHAALAFVVVLLGIACTFLALHAEFLAVVQVLLYVGAIMTLVIFAIMLTNRFSDKTIAQHNKLGAPVLLGGVTFFVLLMNLIFQTPWVIQSETLNAVVTTKDLGISLMTTYLFPFEIIAIVLTSALIGAIIIARKEEK